MKRGITYILLIFLLINCKKRNSDLIYNSKLLLNSKMIISDSKKIIYSKGDIIGSVGSSNVWEDYFILTDSKQKKVFIFDNNFNYIKSIGERGEGPGEYLNTPQIVLNATPFSVFDAKMKKMNYYDVNFNYYETKVMDDTYIYEYLNALSIDNRIIFSVSFPSSMTERSYYYDYKSLIMLDMDLKSTKEFFVWDEVYLNESTFTFACQNFGVLLTSIYDNNFYTTQKASELIYKMDNNLNTQIIFGRKSEHAKKPPIEISASQVQKSYDAVIKYYTKITTKENLFYDYKSNLLFVEYSNPTEDALNKRDGLLSERYLQVYNSDYDVVFDKRINGKFLFSYLGKIYILEEETPEYLSIKIYELQKI